MAYIKINFESTTLLTPELFNTLETQYDEIMADWAVENPRMMADKEFVVEVLASASTHAEGRMYFNSTDEKLYISDGTNWIEIEGEVV